MEPITFKVKKCQTPSDFSASFNLQLVGSLPVHSLTTMSMLPWIVAEIQLLSAKSSKEEPSVSQIRLCVSPASLRCEPDTGETQQWDPLICSSLFEYKPQQVHKLIHNSHDPSYFACLIKDEAANQQSICYVFKADDQTKEEGTDVTCFADARLERIGSAHMLSLQTEGAVCEKPVGCDEGLRIVSAIYVQFQKK